MSTNARVMKVLDQLCSCCLDEGRLTNLWLVAAGLFFVAFCPECDGKYDIEGNRT